MATASRLRAAQGPPPPAPPAPAPANFRRFAYATSAADRRLNRGRASLATAACRRRSMPRGDSQLACQGDKGAVRCGWWAALRRQCHVGASDDTYRVEKAHAWPWAAGTVISRSRPSGKRPGGRPLRAACSRKGAPRPRRGQSRPCPACTPAGVTTQDPDTSRVSSGLLPRRRSPQKTAEFPRISPPLASSSKVREPMSTTESRQVVAGS